LLALTAPILAACVTDDRQPGGLTDAIYADRCPDIRVGANRNHYHAANLDCHRSTAYGSDTGDYAHPTETPILEPSLTAPPQIAANPPQQTIALPDCIPPQSPQVGQVAEIVDGDTIHV